MRILMLIIIITNLTTYCATATTVNGVIRGIVATTNATIQIITRHNSAAITKKKENSTRLLTGRGGSLK